MKIKPLFDRVVVLPINEQKASHGGLVLPETAMSEQTIGKIVAVGSGTTFDGNSCEMFVKPNDTIVFNKYTCDEVKLDNTTHYVLRQIDIIGVLDD